MISHGDTTILTIMLFLLFNYWNIMATKLSNETQFEVICFPF